MLHELFIRDLALINKARVRFGGGLNVLTGETGAGKTVVVGAVNLLLGGRADNSMIRRGCDRAEVQGLFSVPPAMKPDLEQDNFLVDDAELIIRRVISADGKNKCYINDSIVTVKTLAEIGRRLLDLHGQHEHQSLFKPSTHIDFLDKYGGVELLRLRDIFREDLKRLRERQRELAAIQSAERELLAKKDLLQFQISEIDQAAPVVDEDEALMREREILRNAQKLYEVAASSVNAISDSGDFTPAVDLIAHAAENLRTVANIDAALDEIAERLNSLTIELEDCAASLKDYASSLDFPPGRLREVEDRLSLLALFKKKYGSSIEEVLEYRDSAVRELLLCDTSGERMARLEGEIVELERRLADVAMNLSRMRKEAAEKFAVEVGQELADLNMVNADFKVLLISEEDIDGLPLENGRFKVYAHGIDRVEFLISANKGEPPRPLAKIASGGEVSRIMLALKIVLADADETPTLIFDEIDVGIGGKTAMAVGKKMSLLSRQHQVMAVTHLSQIASFADSHFSIEKKELDDKSITEIDELFDEGRIREIARLLSGKVDSDLSLKHAEELLFEAEGKKASEARGRTN
ncbi:MAG: DNA repair protein RecN [Candidatus Aquicultor primus]|uniref:DNA repair protein RecN n=1 Tax=Candidatus Aquicultor primus TaxID=1797195 RepID=A0A1F2UI36_9ACTN|nr:MAG: DNA repair protein RecN [Candidatus Aquicultor primus]